MNKRKVESIEKKESVWKSIAEEASQLIDSKIEHFKMLGIIEEQGGEFFIGKRFRKEEDGKEKT